MDKILTTCPYCGCGCGMYLTVSGDRVVGVTPSQNHPVGQGKLCVKGWTAYEFVNHPDRLTAPLVKTKDGFKEVSWEEAYEVVANKLSEIKAQNPDQIGFMTSARCTNEDNFALMKFARAVIGSNNIDNCARV